MFHVILMPTKNIVIIISIVISIIRQEKPVARYASRHAICQQDI